MFLTTDMNTKLTILLCAAFAVSAHCGQLSPEEQALFDRHLVVEVIRPGEHSGHHIETMTGSKGSGPALVFVFGQEDVEAARKSGLEMAAKGLGPDAAVQHLLAEAREKYHGDKFFTKCFMDEAANAYNSTK